MIYTFYSFKGGVGRSMALANVAASFQQAGARVALVDWDLEAPGLESYFVSDPAELDEIRSSIGLMDVLSSYRRTFHRLEWPARGAGASVQEQLDRDVELLDRQLPPLGPALYPLRRSGTSGVLLLHAGWRTGTRFKAYAEAVQSFDWTEFYSDYRGEAYFEWMRRQLLRDDIADVVMIDSRTGVTEMGGVCTRQLADVVVCFSVMNQQNLQGNLHMAGSFVRSDLMERRGRPLQTVFVPARVDSFNTTLKNELQREFDERFARYTPAVLRAVKASFWDLRIPYISDYAYRERLAVGDPHADKDLEESYRKIAAHLAILAPRSSQLRALCSSEIERVFGRQLPDAVVVYEEEALAEHAREVVRRIKETSLSVWPEPLLVRSRGTAELHSAISQARVVVALGGADALASGWIRSVWRAARERGLGIIPARVKEGAHAARGGPGSPEWLNRTPLVELPGQWSELVERLREPRVPPRLLAMAPPLASRYVPRHHESEAVIAELLETKMKPASGAVVLWGLAGSGKTTVVAGVCKDERVQDAFPDGVLWISLAEGVELASELRRCLAACGRQPAAESSEAELRRELELQLKMRQCLVVLDEAQDVEQVHSLMLAAAGSAHVVTTRFRRLAYAIDGSPIVVGGLTLEEAQSLLALRGAAELRPGADTNSLVDTLISKVGSSAVAVNRISCELARRMDQGQPLEQALSELSENIEALGIGALEQGGEALGAESIQGSLGASFDRLSEEDKTRLASVVERCGTSGASLSDIAELLRESPKRLREWVDQMADNAFVRFDQGLGTVSVHPLVGLLLEGKARARTQGHGMTGGATSSGSRPQLGVEGAVDESVSGVASRAGAPRGLRSGPLGRGWLLPGLAGVSLLGLLGALATWPAIKASSSGAARPEPSPAEALAPSPAPGAVVESESPPASVRPRLGEGRARAALAPGDAKRAPDSASARLAEEHLRLAGRTQAMGEYHAALDQYRQAAALNPGSASAWLGQADAALALGQPGEAMESFGKVLDMGKQDTFAEAEVSRQQLVLAHLGRALALSQRAAPLERGAIDLEKGDGARALAEIDEALALDPSSASVQLARGRLLEQGGRPREAIESYSRAIDIDPELAEAHFQRGRVYQALAEASSGGEAEARRLAAADFRKVLSLARAEPRTARAARARLQQLGERAQAPEPVSVHLQYSSRLDADVLAKLRARLERMGFSVPAPELTEARVSASNLYYYFPDDENQARLVKAAVEASLAAEGIDLPVPTHYRSVERFPSAKPRRLELWLPSLAGPVRSSWGARR